ncbi:MAG: MBL fold metallo-hydrolase [Lentisphaeria bacterium]|nr:MBL fold metallo-hydrolase [Lentisphaeria bacterium]
MKIEILPTGPLSTNCYLIYLEDKRVLYIVDPGADPENIAAHAKKYDAEKCAILLTHAHADHIGAAGKVAKELNVSRTWLGDEDKFIYDSPDNHIFPYYSRATDRPETSEFDPEGDFEVRKLPGHSPGGAGFLFRHNGDSAFFVGDSIFEGSIGRTDLWGGDFDVLIESIQREVLSLEDDLILFPGHGPSTTVGRERSTNPYIRR